MPGGIAGLAQTLAIDPVPDRARFVFEVTRLLYDNTDIRSPSVAAFLQAVRQPARGRPSPLGPVTASEVVPVPLTAEIWSDAIFRRRVTREELLTAILADREAALVCHGLSKLDDETLGFFAGRRAILTRIYERTAPVFASFAGALRVRDGRVVPPGGPDAAAMWEAVAGDKVARPDRFIQALLEASDGRLAYVYDSIDHLDPPRLAFALGTWMPAADRLERFRSLADGLYGVREWHVRTMPFSRSPFDLAMALMRLGVGADGRPSPPASRGWWTRVFNGSESDDDRPIDAAWLAEHIVATDIRQRADRLDQVTFAQRVFGAAGAADRADALFVLRAMPRFRALVLSFERIGIRNPATYASMLRHAAKLAALEGRRGYVAQSQLQGSLVLVTRMTAVGTLDLATAERLIGGLSTLPNDGGYAGGVARWLRERVHPVLPAARDLEGAIVAGLAGRPEAVAGVRRVTWEGQRYRLDLTASEHNRLRRVREKQRAPAIDVPLQLAEAARVLRADTVSTEDLQDAAAQFAAIAADLPQRTREEEADKVPPGVAVPPPLHEVLKKAIDDLTRAARAREPRRGARIAETIVDLADDLLARNLLSFAYAISLGDPDGTVLLADDVSHRHDFGFGLKDSDQRARLAWAVPRPEVAPGVPWHVNGSLMGLDVALSALALRRVSADPVLAAPRLTSNARETFATSVSLMDPLALRDADRDAIADAVARGERRVDRADSAEIDAIAAELSLDAARHRAIRWTQEHDRPRVPSLLSLMEMLVIGGGHPADLEAWGMGVVATNGCFCSRLRGPDVWPALAGRPQLGLAAAILPDVNFRVAIVLKELDLPASLARVILSAAMQDFIDEARATDDADWLSLSRAARAISRERIEDYVAAATATGPLMPDVSRSPELAP